MAERQRGLQVGRRASREAIPRIDVALGLSRHPCQTTRSEQFDPCAIVSRSRTSQHELLRFVTGLTPGSIPPSSSSELALQHVSMFIRSTNDVYQIVEPLAELGWRYNKNSFLAAKNGTSKDERYLLTWVEMRSFSVSLSSSIVLLVPVRLGQEWRSNELLETLEIIDGESLLFVSPSPLFLSASSAGSHRRSLRQRKWNTDGLAVLSQRFSERSHPSGPRRNRCSSFERSFSRPSPRPTAIGNATARRRPGVRAN